MPSHMGTVSRMLSGRLRQLDRRLHIDDSEESEWVWAIPVVGFAVTVAILIVAGVMSGVWAAEPPRPPPPPPVRPPPWVGRPPGWGGGTQPAPRGGGGKTPPGSRSARRA